jgi:hypothetical protein
MVFADVDVEVDRVYAKGRWGVILELNRFGLGFSHPRILGGTGETKRRARLSPVRREGKTTKSPVYSAV